MPLFHTYIIVDWSAKSELSSAKPCRDAIWWAIARAKSRNVMVEVPEYARGRHNAIERLAAIVTAERTANRRVLLGFDLPFGFPAGVAKHLTGSANALKLWDWLDKRIKDNKDNNNNRFEVAGEINQTYPGVGPFWGCPAKSKYLGIPAKKSSRTCQELHPREYRIADLRAEGAKTVWQLYGAGSVGSQVLVGLPAIKRLISHLDIGNQVSIWPFQTGLCVPDASVIIVEIYPSLIRHSIDRKRNEDEILDRAQVRVNAEAFASLDAQGDLALLFKGDINLTSSKRQAIETEEGWILGLGYKDTLNDHVS